MDGDEKEADSLAKEIKFVFHDVPDDRMILNLGKELNSEFNLDTIMGQSFDAVFIGMGLPEPIITTDKKIEGLWDAITFLSAAKNNTIDLKNKTVGVTGGGSTAMDAAITAKDLGAEPWTKAYIFLY